MSVAFVVIATTFDGAYALLAGRLRPVLLDRRRARLRNGISGLSMGMSADYDVAVQFGATHIRVGTAIFGPRNPPPAG